MNESWNRVLPGNIQGNILTGKSLPFYLDHFHRCSNSRKSTKIFEPDNNFQLSKDKLLELVQTFDNLAQQKSHIEQINNQGTEELQTTSKTLHIDLTELTQGKHFHQSKTINKRNQNCISPRIKISNDQFKDTPIWSPKPKSNNLHCTERRVHHKPVSNGSEPCVKLQNIDIKVNNMILKAAYCKKQNDWSKTGSPGLRHIVQSKAIAERISELNEMKRKTDNLSNVLSVRNSLTSTPTKSCFIKDKQTNSPQTFSHKSQSLKQQILSQQTVLGEIQNVSNNLVSYKIQSSSSFNYIPSEKYRKSKTILTKKLLMPPKHFKKPNYAAKTEEFGDGKPKLHLFHEMVVSLNNQKLSSSKDNWLNQIYRKIKENKENTDTTIEQLRQSITGVNGCGESMDFKSRTRELNRSNAFYSKVRPFSTVTGQMKANIDRNSSLVTKSTQKEVNLNNRSSFCSEAEAKRCSRTANVVKQFSLKKQLSITAPNQRILSQISLKYNQRNRKDLEWKLNLFELQRRVRRYTQNRVNPLSEEMKIKQENRATDEFKAGLDSGLNVISFKEIIPHLNKNQNVSESKNPKLKTVVNSKLPDELILKKSKLFPSTVKNKKSLKNYQNLFRIKRCLPQKPDKAVPEINATSSESDVKKTNNHLESDDCGAKPCSGHTVITNMDYHSYKNEATVCSSGSSSKILKFNANSNKYSKRSSSLEPNRSIVPEASDCCLPESFSKDTLKAFIYNSKSSYMEYEHRKFRGLSPK
ncbi:uncharacterized protein LOC115214477 isoform X1 [Octopus sinensis]|uniref:Uncharacterized protein LOC115214477 isoform X1 n=1 Tax=Octopus sinensis TaxID=2607531 RepID=A0A6P7SNT4_9MOLL|nr:uncharacterized protein LOC115214477 isoform X1 [Octopus sinensis]